MALQRFVQGLEWHWFGFRWWNLHLRMMLQQMVASLYSTRYRPGREKCHSSGRFLLSLYHPALRVLHDNVLERPRYLLFKRLSL